MILTMATCSGLHLNKKLENNLLKISDSEEEVIIFLFDDKKAEKRVSILGARSFC